LFRLLDIQQKISTLSSARENVERQCYNLRDEMSEILNKLDNVTMEVKDVQGAQQVYSKMLEAQSLQLVRKFFPDFLLNNNPVKLFIYRNKDKMVKRKQSNFQSPSRVPLRQGNYQESGFSIDVTIH
jgi:hypothetical protein